METFILKMVRGNGNYYGASYIAEE